MKVSELRKLLAEFDADYEAKVRTTEDEEYDVESVSVNDTQQEIYVSGY